ncbi:MAG: DUF4876 domain-containing protein [Alphaproteobacteria bacterium]|nr:DUF4876 domain-containing protein [Alphaproteobacteria bacterium]
MVVWMLAACAPGDDPDASTVPEDPMGRLVIAELYYSGAAPAAGQDHYFSDQFVKLGNASDVPIDVGGVLLGDVYGLAGPINPGDAPDSFASDDPDHVYLENVWRIPDGVVLEPGDTLVVAHDGTNHQPVSPVDLTGADFETFVADSGGDEDYPLVPNLEEVHFTGGYDWLITVFGPSVVVLAADAELVRENTGFARLRKAPVAAVIDGIDTVMDADSGGYKRLPDAVDAGFVHVSGTYVGESVRRVRVGGTWQDTDDTTADFERSTEPAPYGP